MGQPQHACFRIGPLPPIEVFGAFLLDGLIARVSWLTRGSLRQGRSSLAAAHASAAEDFISAAEDFIARGDWREVSLETRARQVQVFAENKCTFNRSVDATLNCNLYQCRTELIGQKS